LGERSLFTVYVSDFDDVYAVQTLGRPFGRFEVILEILWLRLDDKDLLVCGSNFEQVVALFNRLIG